MSARIPKFINRQIFWTEDTLSGSTTRQCIYIPSDPWLYAQVIGCLSLMSDVNNWEQRGTVNVVDAASAIAEMIEGIADCGGEVIGELKYGAFKAGFEPENWIKMDGGIHLKADYPDLLPRSEHVLEWSATEFRTIDMRGRTLVSIRPTSSNFGSVNSLVGAETVNLTGSQNGSHSHNIPNIIQAPVQSGAGAVALAYAPIGAPFSTNNSGSGSGHNNIQPSATTDLWIVGR